MADVYNDDLGNDDNDDDFEADEHEGESDSDLAEEEEGEDEGKMERNGLKSYLWFKEKSIELI